MKFGPFDLFKSNMKNFRFECIRYEYEKFSDSNRSNIFDLFEYIRYEYDVYSIYSNIFDTNMAFIQIYSNIFEQTDSNRSFDLFDLFEFYEYIFVKTPDLFDFYEYIFVKIEYIKQIEQIIQFLQIHIRKSNIFVQNDLFEYMRIYSVRI